MQKVEAACRPRPHATSLKKLFLSSPSSPERPSRGTVAFTCRRGTGISDRAAHSRSPSTGSGGRGNLGGLGVVQVPELDVAVAGGNKVGAVV